MEAQKNQYLNLIKFLACIFITNSHCIYNNPFLKLGGGWGNAIFFATTGYLLGGANIEFWKWIRKRWKRVVPLTAIMTMLSVWTYGLSGYSVFEHVTRFWFVVALVIYYVPFYWADKTRYGYQVAITIHIIGYILLYLIEDKSLFFVEKGGFSYFKVYFYILIMLLGGCIKKYRDNDRYPDAKISILFAGLGLMIWFIEYFLIKVLNICLEFQFLIHIGITLFGISVLMCALSLSSSFPRWQNPRVIEIIAESTLEVYLLQIVLLPLINNLTYPITLVAFWVVALVGGSCLHLTRNYVLKRMMR